MAGKLFVIDLMPFLYKGHFVFLRNPRLTATGINTSALLGLANGLMSILKREQPTHAVLAMDPGGPTFRHKAYPPYKQQRQKMPEDLAASIPYAYELAAALKIPVVTHEGFEADDVMGTLAVKGAEAGFDVCLATPDKDAAQLVRPGVRLYRPAHAGDAAEIYDEAGVCEHWHLTSPKQMIDYLALAGDASDNIPGIRGVGEKTAADLLAKYGDVEGILVHAQCLKGKLAEKVALGAEDAKMSKFLTTIRTDVPIEPDWDAYRLDGVDREKLAEVCAKFELNRLAKEFGVTEEVMRREARDASGASPQVSSLQSPFASLASSLTPSSSPSLASQASSLAPAPTPLATLATTPHDYRLVTTEAEAQALLAELMKADLIAFDTETAAVEGHASTEAHHCKMVGFSFAVDAGGQQAYNNKNAQPSTPDSQPARRAWYVIADLIDIFRPLFADPAKTFVGHNVKFDRSVLQRYGIGFASVPHDTMLAHYCLDAAARHGMDTLAEQYLDYRPIPITALIGEKARGREQLSMAALKPEEILDYAAEDADVTLRLEHALRPQAMALGKGERQEASDARGRETSDASEATPQVSSLKSPLASQASSLTPSASPALASQASRLTPSALPALASQASSLTPSALPALASQASRLTPSASPAPLPAALADVEEPLVKVLIEMEREGVKIDVAALKAYGAELDREILALVQEILSYAEPGFNPDSPRQLGELLFGKLGLAGGKKTATGQFATDEKTLQKLVGAHPIVAKILEYRACAKLKSTYVDKLPTLIDSEGRVHTTYAQAFTETGRLSSSDPNLQNIPIRTERGRMIRKAFVARDAEHVLLSADYSQIELRLMAAFSRDAAMLEAFRNGEDIHRDTAARVFDVMPAFVTGEQRAKCKMVNFGIIYGISAFGLSQRLNVPRKEAASLIETYFKLYPRIRAYMDEAIAAAREKGFAETVLGRRRTLRDINSRNATARQAAERDAINTPIQGSAADLIKVAMVRVDRAIRAAGLRAKMVLQIHDELVFDVPREEVEALREIVRREMTTALDFGVPLEVGIGVGDNWLDAH